MDEAIKAKLIEVKDKISKFIIYSQALTTYIKD